MNRIAVDRIRVSNPFFEGANSVYLIASDPPALIDTGVATQRAFDVLVAGLEEHNVRLADIGLVILTHKHIDHIGNAWRVQQHSGAEVWIHQSELGSVTDVDPDGKRFTELVRQRLEHWQAPTTLLDNSSSNKGLKWEIESVTASGLVDGQRIDLGGGQLQVIHTPGHTMGSICLRFGKFLFTGDHVLQDLSPNIGGGDMRQRGLLRQYLNSLVRITAAEDAGQLQIMPGHGRPFHGLKNRCRELKAHHDERLDKTLTAVQQRDRQSVYQIARELFGEMKDFHVVLGCAEAAAHLEYLEDDEQVVCDSGMFKTA